LVFREVVAKVGDWAATLFWYDRWLRKVPLCQRFSRLFDLAENKSFFSCNYVLSRLGKGGEAWQWRRRMWAWEEELVAEWRILLANVTLQSNVSDHWKLHLDISGDIRCVQVISLLTTRDSSLLDDSENLIWHSQVPLKGFYFSLAVAS
jgi:hypothetical protein